MQKLSKAPNYNLRFSFVQGSYWVTVLIFNGYYGTYLRDFGYDGLFFGAVMMSIGVSCLFLQPLFGYLADRFSHIREMMLITTGLFTFTFPLFFRFLSSKAFVIVFTVVVIGGMQSTNGLLDSWVAKLQKQLGGLDYGKVRGVGSMAYAVAAVILGRLLTSFGNEFAIYVMGAVYVVFFISALRLPNPEKVATAVGEKSVTFREATGAIFKNKAFVVFLACSFLVAITSHTGFTYYSLLIRSLGGTQTHVGLAYFILAFSEFFVVRSFTKLRRRFGATLLLGIGMVGYAVKALALSLSTSVAFALVASLTQMISFAFVIPGCVAYMSEQIELKYLASATLLYQCMSSLASVVGNPMFGAVQAAYGDHMVLRVFSVCALVGGSIFLIYNRKNLRPTPDDVPELKTQSQLEMDAGEA